MFKSTPEIMPVNDKLSRYARRNLGEFMMIMSNDDRLRPTIVDGQVYLSLVGLMELFGDSNRDSRKVWNDEKARLRRRAPQLSAEIGQLKLLSSDGKSYSTDVARFSTCYKILLYMNTPSSDWFKDAVGEALGKITEEQFEAHVAWITRESSPVDGLYMHYTDKEDGLISFDGGHRKPEDFCSFAGRISDYT